MYMLLLTRLEVLKHQQTDSNSTAITLVPFDSLRGEWGPSRLHHQKEAILLFEPLETSQDLVFTKMSVQLLRNE